MAPMTACNRCKVNVASMIHSSKKRADGSIYRIYWCRDCQRSKQNNYNKHSGFLKRISSPQGWNAEAKATELRLARKYAPTVNIRTGDRPLV